MEHHLYHRHLIVNAIVNNPPKCPQAIEDWTRGLVKKLGMSVLLGPYAVYSDKEGNRGLTCITAIDTSSITLHTWDEVEPAQIKLDVYTCSELDINDVFEEMQVWDPVKVGYRFYDRDEDLILIREG